MLTRVRHSLNTTSLALVVTLVFVLAMAGSASAAGGQQPAAGGLLAPFPSPLALSPAFLVRDHESTFGSFGSGSPQALTVDQATGDVYVLDTPEKRVLRFTASGLPHNFTAGPAAGTNALTGLGFQGFPSYDEVAVDASDGPAKGDIYVTNSSAGHVSVFASTGEPLGTLTGSGTPGGSLGEDCGVAVDQANGDVYVASRGGVVSRYSPSVAPVVEGDYSGGIETGIEPCQIAVAQGNLYAKAWQEFPVEGAGPVDQYVTSAFAAGSPPSVSGTQIVTRATAVAADPVNGDVYADERSKVTVYDPSGATLYSYGTGEIGTLSAGVAVIGGGNSYVSDANNHEIHIYGPTLEAGSRANLGAIGSFTGESPQALTVDQASGDVYAVDPSAGKLWRFSSGGAPKDFTAGPDAGTNTLTGLSFQFFPSIEQVAVDASSGPAKGDIYVTQSPSGQVKVFSSSGERLGTLTGSETPSGGLGEACGVAVDQSNGDLYIGDRSNRIWRYTPSGATVSETDYTGGIETSIAPCQIAVANGNVYAKDWQEFPVEGAGPLNAYAISAFATGTPPSASATQVATKVTAVATDPSSGDVYADERSKVTVYGSSGAPVYSFASGEIGNSSAGVAIKANGGDAYVDDAASHKVRIYGPFSAPPPLLEAKPASSVGHVKATMNAHLDPNNSLPIASCAFEWGTDTSYSETPIACEQGSSYTEPADVSAQLAGLTPGTTYHYRLHVTTSTSSFTSQDEHFETIPASSTPEAKTGKGTILSSTSTELEGAVDPNANPLTGCHFEYVTETAYQNTGFGDLSSGGSLPCTPEFASIPVDYEGHEVTATATGLEPQENYRYRLVAENTSGPGASEAELIPGPPIVETTGSPTRTTTTARLDSRVYPHGASANYWFEYVADAQYKESGFTNATSTPHQPATVNDIQRIEVDGPGQFFTLGFGGYATPDLTSPASAGEVQDALNALPSIGQGNVHVELFDQFEGSTHLYTVTFQGAFADTDVKELVASRGASNPVTNASVLVLAQGGPGARTVPVSAQVQALRPATSYHYRLVADNGTPGGPTIGADRILTTRATEAPLTHGRHPGPPGSDRAWEQVSIPDTSGNGVQALSLATGGERAVYGIDGGSPGSTYGGSVFKNSNNQLAERTTSGWQRRELYPTRVQATGNIWVGPWGDSQLTKLYAGNFDETGSGTAGLFRLTPNAPAQLLFSRPIDIGNDFYASEDGSRLVGDGNGTVDPNYTFEELQHEFYDFSAGTPRLIGLLPDGSVPLCGANPGYMQKGGEIIAAQHWVTPDGSHFFFNSFPGSGCSGQGYLYDRDLLTSKTALIAPRARFIRYAAGAVFFVTEENLISSDHGGKDIYRYEVDDGSVRCVTCSTPAAGDVETDTNIPNDFYAVAVSDDGSRVYFTGPRRVLPGAAAPGIYRIDVETEDLAYIAPALGSKVSASPAEGGGLSPDGTFFAFRSGNPGLNAIGGPQNAGTAQYYLYNDRDRSLICVSCPPDGSAPRGEVRLDLTGGNAWDRSSDPVTDGGDYVFATPTPLVPADQNTAAPGQEALRGEDIYELRDGRPLLVSDGKSESPGGEIPLYAGLAAGGRDVFFMQSAALTPDAIDATRHLYDARIGGGFDFPSPRPPCSLEACQGTPLPAPNDATPASLSFSGPGNQSNGQSSAKECVGSKCAKGKSQPRKRCAKGRVRKRGKCVKKVQRKSAKRANHYRGGAK